MSQRLCRQCKCRRAFRDDVLCATCMLDGLEKQLTVQDARFYLEHRALVRRIQKHGVMTCEEFLLGLSQEEAMREN